MVLERKTHRRRERGLDLQRKNLVLDPFVIKVVNRVAERDSQTFSAALCSLVVEAALNEPELQDFIRDSMKEAMEDELEKNGFYPEMVSVVTSRLLGQHAATFEGREVPA